MVVPGRIGDSLSEGCNELIKLGAAIITRPEDILEIESIRSKIDNNGYTHTNNSIEISGNEINVKAGVKTAGKKSSVQEFELATPKNMLYSCVDLYPVGINELVEKTGLSLQQISSALVELEIEGKIEEVANNCYARVYTG